VAQVWARGARGVELAMVEPLLPGALYVVRDLVSNTQASLVYRSEPPAAPAAAGDPEAEAFGCDLDWLSPRSPSGDVVVVSGLPALRHDVAALAHLSPSELPHRPLAGMGLVQRVNGTDPGELGPEAAATLRSDPRVAAATCEVVRDPVRARVELRTTLTTTAFPDENVRVTTRLS
jgi:hypothetical protein